MESTISSSDQLSVIDASIARLTAELEDLRVRRNSYAPVSKLPPEIMENIFLFRRDDHYGSNNPSNAWQWIQEVSHVCRSWRLAALQSRELWSRVSFESPEYAELLLNRSERVGGGGPISVEIRSEPTDEEDEEYMWEAIACESQRVKSLDIQRNSGGSDEFVWPLGLPWNPAPILEFLRMEVTDDDLPVAGLLMLDHSSLLFAGHTPRLRHLELTNLLIPWSSSILTANITTLKLTWSDHISRPAISPGTPTEFFRALDQMPSLETLDIFQLFNPEMNTFRSDDIVALPKIKQFTLKGITKQCTVILKHLSVPPTACLSLIPLQLDSQTGIEPLSQTSHLPGVLRMIRALHKAWIRHGEACRGTHWGAYFCFFRLKPGGCIQLRPIVPKCNKELEENTEPGTLMLHLPEELSLQILPSKYVHFIDIVEDTLTSKSNRASLVRHIFNYFPKTVHICLRDSFTHTAFMEHIKAHAFDPPAPENDSNVNTPEADNSPSEPSHTNDEATPPAPEADNPPSTDPQAPRTNNNFDNLTILSLQGVKFKVPNSNSNSDDTTDRIDVEDLLAFLRMRSERGKRLMQLRLSKTHDLKEEDVERLRACVDDLEWTQATSTA
ncbi:hypothetical protein CVT24_003087 [Panaeolus cyanescens]|uniref:F-box domain-containing protein n=1 Tax=Panaeolus cyanescens TaxID=181874 RepID=A0A409W8Q0_9AGAR|nr:hypothetical protein CVT24_003087 [Panaeolus cyanescens]